MAEIKERIGARIKQAREARTRDDGRPWTQGDLARALPGTVDAASVSRWETGKVRPSDDTLELIAEALGRDVSYFLAPEVAGTADLMRVLSNSDESQLDRIERMLRELLALAKQRDPFGLGEAVAGLRSPGQPSREPQAPAAKPSRRRRAG